MSKAGCSKDKSDYPDISPRRQRKLAKTLSDLPNVPERVILSYTISKEEGESWGIRIVGGAESVSSSIYIKGILPNSVCELDENLKVGDELLEVNGESLVNKTHEEAVDMFRRCQTKVNIVLSRMVESKHQVGNHSPLSPYHCRVLSRHQSNGFDDEPVVLEHKSLQSPKKSTTIW